MRTVYKSEDGQIFENQEECFKRDIEFLTQKQKEFENQVFEYKRKLLPNKFKEYLACKNITFEEYKSRHPNMTKLEARASSKLEYFSNLLNLKELEKKYKEVKKGLYEIITVKRNITKLLSELESQKVEVLNEDGTTTEINN